MAKWQKVLSKTSPGKLMRPCLILTTMLSSSEICRVICRIADQESIYHFTTFFHFCTLVNFTVNPQFHKGLELQRISKYFVCLRIRERSRVYLYCSSP